MKKIMVLAIALLVLMIGTYAYAMEASLFGVYTILTGQVQAIGTKSECLERLHSQLEKRKFIVNYGYAEWFGDELILGAYRIFEDETIQVEYILLESEPNLIKYQIHFYSPGLNLHGFSIKYFLKILIE